MLFFFFFKQKTAYEMRISDWSSDVCSSDLERGGAIERIAVPLLILAARTDRLVSTPAIERIAARIAGARLHVYGREAAHEILRELDPVRLDALARIDRFLDEVAPNRIGAG